VLPAISSEPHAKTFFRPHDRFSPADCALVSEPNNGRHISQLSPPPIMKKSLLLAPVVLIAGYALAIIARLAGYTSFNVLPVSAAVGGMVVCSQVQLAPAE
jgi:hypothetical protein